MPPPPTLSPGARSADRRAFLLKSLPVVVSGAALVGFSLIDVQACMDFVPLMPFFALGTGITAMFAVALIVAGLARVTTISRARATTLAGVVVGLALLGYGTADAFTQEPQNGLAKQHQLVAQLVERLDSEDRIQQFGDATLFVMTGRQNATHFMHLGEKQGLGIFEAEGVTIPELVRELEAVNPRMIILSRARTKGWADALFEWIGANYTLDSTLRKGDGGTRGRTDVWLRKE